MSGRRVMVAAIVVIGAVALMATVGRAQQVPAPAQPSAPPAKGAAPAKKAAPVKKSAPAKPAAPELKVAVLLGSSGRGDKGFNDAVFAGLEAAKKQGRLRVTERLPMRPEDYAHAIDEQVAEDAQLIIGVGFLYSDPFAAASVRHPKARFLLLDVELPGVSNVKSVTFRGDEGSFLAGVAAAAETKRGVVGFVGGMNMPIIQAFECGWETGVRWGTKEAFKLVTGSIVYLGTTPEAFTKPAEGEARAHELITRKNVDVLFAAAGASGLGVIEAARRAKVTAIGVDTDQSHLAKDTVITSMRKRLDRAVETTVAEVRKGAFQGGVTVMNLANGGVDLVLPGKLAPPTVKLVERARVGIVAGRIPVCVKESERVPAWNFPPRPQS